VLTTDDVFQSSNCSNFDLNKSSRVLIKRLENQKGERPALAGVFRLLEALE